MSDEILTIRLQAQQGAFRLEVAAELPARGITAVFGPSGSGKTSLLRQIAGLDRLQRGHVSLGGAVWYDSETAICLAPHRRPVGMVFQDARLFAHLDVGENLDYAARRAGPGERRFDRETIIDALDLGPLLPRRTPALSGGEAQRVALARALLSQPRLLLLDEPMAGLDQGRKAELLPYLDRTLRQLAIPALYVSHSVDEVIQIADRVLALSEGRHAALGTPEDVFEQLDIEHLDRGLEAGSVLAGRFLDRDERLQLSRIELGGQRLELAMPTGLQPGDAVRVRIRARDVALATHRPDGLSIRNVLEGRITAITPAPGTPWADLDIQLAAGPLKARVTRASVEDLELVPGQAVFALVKSASFDRSRD